MGPEAKVRSSRFLDGLISHFPNSNPVRGEDQGLARLCNSPISPCERVGESPSPLDRPPLFLGPRFPHLIEEGRLRLTISGEFFSRCLLLGESLRCPILRSLSLLQRTCSQS